MKRLAGLLAYCVATSLACAPTAVEGPAVAIRVAPLDLPGVTDADWRVTVTTAADTVWTRDLTSGAYGDGGGGLSYVGPCDADAGTNTVTVELLALYGGASGDALLPAAGYANPGPIAKDVTCLADADVAVDFDVTVARAADQGFFDVAVSFDDLFCSAKLDCVRSDTSGPILLLPDDTGARRPTVVLGFACTADTGAADTVLYLDDVDVTCDGGVASVDPTAGPGVLHDGAGITQSALAPILFGASVFRGAEPLAGVGKVYWNVALGLALDTAQVAHCRLTTTGTAAAGPLAGDATPAGATYPILTWDVPLTTAGDALTCTSHPVNGGNGVAVAYAAATFDHSFDGGATATPVQATGLPSCAHVLAAAPGAASGVYSLDPDGPGAAPAYDAYCDMQSDGGGWTLVQAKTTPSFVMTTPTVDLACASVLSGDCASAVDPRLPWNQALWRFAGLASPLVTWQRTYDDVPVGLAGYLTGYAVTAQARSVPGFDRFVGGAWSGLQTVDALYYGVENPSPLRTGLSESHGAGTDQWIDLWNTPDASNDYTFVEGADATLQGTKCLAGECRADTLWMLVRDASVCGAACGQPVYPRSCAALLGAAPATPSGTYTLDPDGPGGRPAYAAYCDMTTDGGGWTLVSTKVATAFVNWAASFTTACASATAADCASAVDPALAWSEALWRPGTATTEAEHVIWTRDPASTFSAFLGGTSMTVDNVAVAGFRKTVSGTTTSGHTIASFYYRAANNISESHGGTDLWLDLWTATDATSSYAFVEGGLTGLQGTKCVAGYCRSGPVWTMVRDPQECGAACGLAPTPAPASCRAILAANPAAVSGLYTIDPDGDGGVAPYSAYCDMTTDGGGWTLVGTKVSPGLNTWSASFVPACASATAADCASAVAPYLAYDDVLWRFSDNADVLVRWAAATRGDFRDFLGGASVDAIGVPVAGFSKTVNGVYTGPHTLPRLHFRSQYGLSEDHADSDLWLDLWSYADSTTNQGYLSIENGDATLSGRKCLAGYCRAAPVWMLVR